MKEYIFISSSDSLSAYDTSSNFSVHLNRAIEHKKEICLESFSVLNTIYNVISSNNNISVSYSATTYNASISEGIYTSTSLTSALKTSLDANGSGLNYTVSYNSLTYKITISAGSAFSLLFGTGSNQINSLIGFESIDTISSTSHTGSYAIDLHSKNLFIQIKELGDNFIACNKNDSMSFVVPNNVNSGEGIVFNRTSSFNQVRDISNRFISHMHIRIVDKNNITIDFHGAETMFIFSIS